MIADGLIHRLSVHAQFGLAGVGAIVADLHGGGIAPGENSVISMRSRGGRGTGIDPAMVILCDLTYMVCGPNVARFLVKPGSRITGPGYTRPG